MKEYAIYNADEFKFIGTAQECANYLGCSLKTFRFYLTPSYHKRLSERKNPKNYIIVIQIEDVNEECLSCEQSQEVTHLRTVKRE
jgi:hypothetical protein